MADKWVTTSGGDWAVSGTWNDTTLPTAEDDVYADGLGATVTTPVEAGTVRNGTRAGGTPNGAFVLAASGAVLTAHSGFHPAAMQLAWVRVGADDITGTVGHILPTASGGSIGAGLFFASGGSHIHSGDVGAGFTAANNMGILHRCLGSLTVNGNVQGGSGDGAAPGITCGASGPLTVNGNVLGGHAGSAGVRNGSGALVTVNGAVSGGGSSGSCGVLNTAGGRVVINGPATAALSIGAHGVLNTGASGVVTINGTTRASQGGAGVLNTSYHGTTIINGAVLAGASGASPFGPGMLVFAGSEADVQFQLASGGATSLTSRPAARSFGAPTGGGAAIG